MSFGFWGLFFFLAFFFVLLLFAGFAADNCGILKAPALFSKLVADYAIAGRLPDLSPSPPLPPARFPPPQPPPAAAQLAVANMEKQLSVKLHRQT